MSNQFPSSRLRRLRQSDSLRALFQETEFSVNDLVLPIFVEEETSEYVPIEAMPGVMRILSLRYSYPFLGKQPWRAVCVP